MRFDRTFWILALVFCASVTLGTYGFRLHGEPEWTTALYKAVQLFNTNSGVIEPTDTEGGTPIILEVARWMALAVTLGAFVVVVTTAFYGIRTWLRLRFTSGHHIVCGVHEKGAAIAADLLDAGLKVAVIEKDEQAPHLVAMRKRGAMVMIGDAREPAVLEKARLDSASKLVCAAGADAVNLAIAMAATKSSAKRGSGLDVYVHIGDVGHRDALQQNNVLAGNAEGAVRLRTFNYFRNLSRRVLKSFPLEVDNDGNLVDDVHVLLPGLGDLESALAAQAALVGHYRNGGKVTIHVVCRGAQAAKAAFLKRYPSYENCARLEAHDLSSDDDFVSKAATLVESLSPDAFTTVSLCGKDQSEMFMDALLLKQVLGHDPKVRLVLGANDDTCFQEMVEQATGQSLPLSRWVVFAPTPRQACGSEAVYNDSLDRVAQKIHGVWWQQNQSAIDAALEGGEAAKVTELRSKSAFKQWGELSERQKDLNRFAADHIEVKIRAAGLDPRTGEEELRRQWRSLDAQTLEMLSRVEHERWSAAMWMSGWKYEPQRDDERRLHNNLVPFDQLSGPTRDNDKAQVKAAVEYYLAAR